MLQHSTWDPTTIPHFHARGPVTGIYSAVDPETLDDKHQHCEALVSALLHRVAENVPHKFKEDETLVKILADTMVTELTKRAKLGSYWPSKKLDSSWRVKSMEKYSGVVLMQANLSMDISREL
jgi:hypothetical protein